MSMRSLVAAGLLSGSASFAAAESFQLPPEVTPALRAACEADVRRLCIVKACVTRKFLQLGRRCQMQITIAGLRP
jgi:hypothetical protein